MILHVGTSGFSYDAWKGSFYPEGLSSKDMLAYYVGRFDTVEINNTFYRMPKPGLLEGWRARVDEVAQAGGEGADVAARFRFVLKAPQRITHQGQLVGVDDAVARFFEVSAALPEARRGPVLVQLPPWLKRDEARLDAFLAKVPEAFQVALEVGHPSWLEPPVLEVLRARGASLVSVDDVKKTVELVRTAPFVYARLRMEAYEDDALRAVAERLRALRDGEGVEQAWVFFKHEDEGKGPAFAARFRAIARDVLDGAS